MMTAVLQASQMRAVRRASILLVMMVFNAMPIARCQADSPIKLDEEIVTFPAYAWRENGQWVVPIHGVIRERESGSLKRRALLSLIGSSIRVKENSAEERRLIARLQPFVADHERGKKLSVIMGEETFTLTESGADGIFRTELRLAEEDAVPLLETAEKTSGWVEYRFVMKSGDERQFGGRVLFLKETGLSVISDIDDTVRDSRVLERSELVANTFLREFQPVAGMPDLYQLFDQAGIPIHYVSATPQPLYEPLRDFFQKDKLPLGTFHLRPFDLKRSSFQAIFDSADEVKRKSLLPLLTRYPHRRFLLIGDSGERDPEIYGQIAKEFPTQITGIWIRNLAGNPCDDTRRRAACDGPLWYVFSAPGDLADVTRQLIEQSAKERQNQELQSDPLR